MIIGKRERGGLALAAAALAVMLAAQPAAAAPSEIIIKDFAFSPKVLTVAPGTEIVWINRDDEPHTIVDSAASKRFKSPPLDTNDRFSLVLKQAGTYSYYCTIHPHMTGTIIVK